MMKPTRERPPKLLPWLARKAGVPDRRAEALWQEAQRHAALRTGVCKGSTYHAAAMDRLNELLVAEGQREGAACFGIRYWLRLNTSLWRAPAAVFDAAALNAARGWRLIGHAFV